MLHKLDIVIGIMGLHESIGWKTAEYVAAGKASVNERLHYEVLGNLKEDVNYLSFDSVEEYIRAVDQLTKNPMEVYQMKSRNIFYYNMYMKPEIMIKRTLNIVGSEMN